QLGAFRQFLALMDKAKHHPKDPTSTPTKTAASFSKDGSQSEGLREAATKLFLVVHADRLAARVPGGNSFQLGDGRKGVATAPASVQALLALEVHESGGKDRAKQTTIPLFLPVEATWVKELYPDECVWGEAEEFDEKKGQMRREERLT